MASAAIDNGYPDVAALMDQRAAPRFTSLIRAAKLICELGEFVCVVRDVSSTGVRLRCFHSVPREPGLQLELQNGDRFAIEWVRGEGYEASFRFPREVSIERLVRDDMGFPRRPLRLNISIPLTLRTIERSVPAITCNVSQQGCRIESSAPLALAQALIIESEQLPGIRAKVRWRRGATYGLVFDDTFSLIDFASHTARLQCPELIVG